MGSLKSLSLTLFTVKETEAQTCCTFPRFTLLVRAEPEILIPAHQPLIFELYCLLQGCQENCWEFYHVQYTEKTVNGNIWCLKAQSIFESWTDITSTGSYISPLVWVQVSPRPGRKTWAALKLYFIFEILATDRSTALISACGISLWFRLAATNLAREDARAAPTKLPDQLRSK